MIFLFILQLSVCVFSVFEAKIWAKTKKISKKFAGKVEKYRFFCVFRCEKHHLRSMIVLFLPYLYKICLIRLNFLVRNIGNVKIVSFIAIFVSLQQHKG